MRDFRGQVGQWAVIAAGLGLLAGCSPSPTPPVKTPPSPPQAAVDTGDDVAAERAKLAPEDRAAVEAQEWCAINTEERLGSMGPPVKVMIQDQAVYLCCIGCRKEALAQPEKTLATVAEHKAKVQQLAREKGKS
jgi:hypothetical protein